ncbi:MAG: tetratricopeptide repeat protein [Gammaproteobacteria bacterium]|nr:tetratricopeptide repeat protein [Gammaproteobacteria bacterium]
MDEALYKFLKWTAIALGCAWVGWSIYDSFMREHAPGDFEYKRAEQFFADDEYQRALKEYEDALDENPQHIYAMRGKARALLQMRRFDEAMAQYDKVISAQPDLGVNYANRGILFDRLGRYEQAIADYEKALALDPELDEGPHWLTRFLRNQPEKPPTIGDRAKYLRAELAKPPEQRVLRVPEIDEKQRTYKQ